MLDRGFWAITNTCGNFSVGLILEIGCRMHAGSHSVSLIPEEMFSTFAQLGLFLPSIPTSALLSPEIDDRNSNMEADTLPHLRLKKLEFLYIGTLALIFSRYQGVSQD